MAKLNLPAIQKGITYRHSLLWSTALEVEKIIFQATTAIVTTKKPYTLTTGDFISVTGIVPYIYNTEYSTITVIDSLTFSYELLKLPTENAKIIETSYIYTPILLTGCFGGMQIRDSLDSVDSLISLTTENSGLTFTENKGKIDIYISDENTLTLSIGTKVYSLEIYHPDGTISGIIDGKIQIQELATR